jgi:hypothetical protein
VWWLAGVQMRFVRQLEAVQSVHRVERGRRVLSRNRRAIVHTDRIPRCGLVDDRDSRWLEVQSFP